MNTDRATRVRDCIDNLNYNEPSVFLCTSKTMSLTFRCPAISVLILVWKVFQQLNDSSDKTSDPIREVSRRILSTFRLNRSALIT